MLDAHQTDPPWRARVHSSNIGIMRFTDCRNISRSIAQSPKDKTFQGLTGPPYRPDTQVHPSDRFVGIFDDGILAIAADLDLIHRRRAWFLRRIVDPYG